MDQLYEKGMSYEFFFFLEAVEQIRFYLHQVCKYYENNYIIYTQWMYSSICFVGSYTLLCAPPYDLLVCYGNSFFQVCNSLWCVLCAINIVPDMSFENLVDVE